MQTQSPPRTLSPVDTRSIPSHYWDNRSLFRDQIIRSAMPLAKGLARRYAGRCNCQYDDLVSVALEALNLAIDDYKPIKASFSTHSVVRMRSAIWHYLRDNSPVPRAWFEAYFKVRKEARKMNRMRKNLGYPTLSLKEVSERLRIQEWDRIVAAMQSPNPIGLAGIEKEYDPYSSEDDLVLKVRQVLFQLPTEQRKSIELWMYRDKRDENFRSAFQAVKELLSEVAS
ncbi:MAG: sigma-70 family RNA polymerase sigma factor [Microcoleus sp.]